MNAKIKLKVANRNHTTLVGETKHFLSKVPG